jgi:hypothetical protein
MTAPTERDRKMARGLHKQIVAFYRTDENLPVLLDILASALAAARAEGAAELEATKKALVIEIESRAAWKAEGAREEREKLELLALRWRGTWHKDSDAYAACDQIAQAIRGQP